MATPLSKAIVKLRKAKELTQGQVADRLKMKRSTYAKKEADGDFNEDDIATLVKIIGGEKDSLLKLVEDRNLLNVEDWKEYLIKNAIDSRAMSRVILMALGEILALQKGESATKVITELTKAVEEEKGKNLIR